MAVQGNHGAVPAPMVVRERKQTAGASGHIRPVSILAGESPHYQVRMPDPCLKEMAGESLKDPNIIISDFKALPSNKL